MAPDNSRAQRHRRVQLAHEAARSVCVASLAPLAYGPCSPTDHPGDSVVPHVLVHDPVTSEAITPILHVPDCSGRAVGASQLSR